MTDVNLPLIAPAGRPHIKCLRCRAFVVWPAELASVDATTLCAIDAG